MVTDHAEARVLVKENMTILSSFEYFLEQNHLQGESTVDSGILVFNS